jgi:hypothetical protein
MGDLFLESLERVNDDLWALEEAVDRSLVLPDRDTKRDLEQLGQLAKSMFLSDDFVMILSKALVKGKNGSFDQRRKR